MKAVLRGMHNVSTYVNDNVDTEGDAVTMRPSATSLFCIDSDDRYANYAQRRSNPSYPFSFNIQKKESLLNGFFKRLALTEFRMNWTLPNIATAWGNNAMSFVWRPTISGTITKQAIILPDGFYNTEDLALELQTQIRQWVPSMDVVISDRNDDSLIFTVPTDSTVYFYLAPTTSSPDVTTPLSAPLLAACVNVNSNNRQLIDMINYPYVPANAFVKTAACGIPNLRPTDYVDLVCSQLTYNQDLKDSSSAPLTRDMVARIYLDDSVPSSSFSQTINYSGTSSSTLTPTAASAPYYNTVEYTVSTAPAAAVKVGDIVFVSGITGTGASGYNGKGYVLLTPDTASPFRITLAMESSPVGTPTFTGSPVITIFSTVVSTSVPQTTWDDRVNGVTPFVLYRQFPYPKQIRWNNKMPIGQVQFEMYDDQGRSLQDLWNNADPTTFTIGQNFCNSLSWSATLLITED